MKHWLMTYLILPALVACGDKDKGNSAGTIATVPPPTTCMSGTYCNSNQYGQSNGYTAYPVNPYYNGSNNGSFCDCPYGYRPVYNGQYGLGCVSAATFQPYSNGAVYWGWGANNNQWVNIPQVSNTQGYPANNSCYRNVAQSCFVDQINSCGGGATCQATGGGSRLGVCTTAGTNSASPNYNGGYR